MTSHVDELRQIAVIYHRTFVDIKREPDQPDRGTMESACQDKKFQSSWKLPFSISLDPERKDSPVNPYHRSVRATMTSPKRTVPNANDNESDIVSGLPEFECDVIASSCLSRETRDSSDETSAVRHRNEDKERRETYWKIKAKVENAVKVTLTRDQPGE